MTERNPILADDQVRERFAALPEDSRRALYDFCAWLYEHARERAEQSWRLSKAPMAVYWKAVAAWAYHIRAAIGRAERRVA